MYQCIAENYWGIKYANAELRVIGEPNAKVAESSSSSFDPPLGDPPLGDLFELRSLQRARRPLSSTL